MTSERPDDALVRCALADAIAILRAQRGTLYPVAYGLRGERLIVYGEYSRPPAAQTDALVAMLQGRLAQAGAGLRVVVSSIAMRSRHAEHVLRIVLDGPDVARRTLYVPYAYREKDCPRRQREVLTFPSIGSVS